LYLTSRLPAINISYLEIGLKSSIYRLSYQLHSSSADCARAGFSNFWCYGAHEEIDHNLRSPTI